MGKVIQESASKGRTSVLASGKMDSKAKITRRIEKAKIDVGTSRWCSGQESTCGAADTAQSLVWEDPTRRGAAEPRRHHSWAGTLGPGATTAEVCMPGACASQQGRPKHCDREQPLVATRASPHKSNRDPGQPKINKHIKFKNRYWWNIQSTNTFNLCAHMYLVTQNWGV